MPENFRGGLSTSVCPTTKPDAVSLPRAPAVAALFPLPAFGHNYKTAVLVVLLYASAPFIDAVVHGLEQVNA